MEQVYKDKVYMRYLLQQERDALLLTYIETHFHEESMYAQLQIMLANPYFANKVLDDYERDSKEKLDEFLKYISYGKSVIITIVGGRGSGKSAFALFIVEQLHIRGLHRKVYYVKRGEMPDWLPGWMHWVGSMEEVPPGSFAVLDETAIEYGNRNSWTDENKAFSERLAILRHKDISLMLITQHSKMVEVNVRRLSDIVVFKKGANIDEDEARDKEKEMIITRLMPRTSKEALIQIKLIDQYMLVETELPTFWDDNKVSKAFKDYNPEETKRKQRDSKARKELEKFREKERVKAELRETKEMERAHEQAQKIVQRPEDLLEL